MLLAGGVSHGRLPAVSTRQPGQRPEDPIAEPETGALKSDLGHAPYIAKAIMLRLGLVLEEFHFDRNAARRWMGHLRRKQPIIRPGRRSEHLSHFALFPFVASNQANGGRLAGFDLFEFPFRKVHDDKSVRAIRKIEDGLPFGHCRTRTGRD